MLTEQTISLIKATTPLIQEHGEAIATKMYEIMFAQYPQTKLLFSKAPLNQPKILARSVIIYSQHIDNITAVHEILEKIAHKHVSVDVHPGHYPMLGHSFIQAMREVLGKSVSEEVIIAWKDAYFYFAELLIEREQALVSKRSTALTQN